MLLKSVLGYALGILLRSGVIWFFRQIVRRAGNLLGREIQR